MLCSFKLTVWEYKMANGWTEERRKKQAEAIKSWKPWKKSTGPRIAEGKKQSSVNALKHGRRRRIDDEFRRLFRLNRELRQLTLKIALRDDMKGLRQTIGVLDNERKS